MSSLLMPSTLFEVKCLFTRGYIAAAFYSTTNEVGDANLDRDFSVSDLAPETWAAIQRDCQAFLEANLGLILACDGSHKPGSPDDDVLCHAGRDFWYSREGHGAGFWDGDWPEAAGQHLTEAASAFGVGDWYVGDNGQIWQFGSETCDPNAIPALSQPAAHIFPAEAALAP